MICKMDEFGFGNCTNTRDRKWSALNTYQSAILQDLTENACFKNVGNNFRHLKMRTFYSHKKLLNG